MKYQFTPEGLSQEEILQRIAHGWAVVTGVKVARPQVAVPGQPLDMHGRADVWFLPEPMMPQGMVIATLAAMARQGGDVVTLNDLARALFGQSLRDLELMMAPVEAAVADDAVVEVA